MSKKDDLRDRVIEKLKNKYDYFFYEEIKILLEKEKIDITPSSLKSYIFELTKKGVIFDAGKGWYSTIKEAFKLNIKPLHPIIRKLKKELPLLEFSCWSTEQLNSFTHNVLSKFITFVYSDADYISNTAYILEKAGYSVFQNPTKQETEKFFKITDKTVVIRPTISKQPEAVKYYSPIEKILVDFLIENRKLYIMDTAEAENTAENIINAGKINISELLSYAKRREFNIQNIINQVQNNIKPEIVG